MSDTEEPQAQRAADPAALERRWQHRLHLDTMLFQRANLFLVVESLLVVAYAMMLGVATQAGAKNTQLALVVVRIIAVFGLLLTMIWAYVAHRHLRYHRLVHDRDGELFPEYVEVRSQWRKRRISSLPLVTYFLPGLAGGLWILLLLVTWR
ncbi:hypothetical protein [Streptosporangium longisporum]|uniref:hypothetical protein n=1 Tax=Streptosporangium longisporum TaxID=46187 RepID=UPI0031EF5F4B